MHESVQKIMDEIKQDDQIDGSNVQISVKSKILKRRKSIIITGTINSQEEKEKVQRTAEILARDDFDIVNELTVRS